MNSPLWLYVIAGEASGDNRGAELLRCLKARQPSVRILGAGGPRIQALADGPFLEWSSEAVVGLWDVLRKYGYFKKQFDRMLLEIEQKQPAALLLIDYPGFNLRLAKAARQRFPKLKILYYISPQVWAWNQGRIPKMAQWLDLMLCIFPFEKALYEASGLKTEFVGHPMLDTLASLKTEQPRSETLVGLFPGSRTREVRKLFPVMLQTARILRDKNPNLQFEVAAASPTIASWMVNYLREHGYNPDFCKIGQNRFYQLAQEAAVGMVCSGTATLESAYFGLPMVILYKVAWPTWIIAKHLVKLPHIGMPNVLAGHEIAREFLQSNATPSAISEELSRLLLDPASRERQQSEFEKVITSLGQPGAATRAAEAVARALAL